MGSNTGKHGYLYWDNKLFGELAPDGKCFEAKSDNALSAMEGDDE